MKNYQNDFKESLLKGATQIAREEMRTHKADYCKEMRVDESLVSMAGGYYLVLDVDDEGNVGARSEQFSDSYFYYKNYPSRKELLELYTQIRNEGVSRFAICWQTDLHVYQNYKDKFDRYVDSDPSGCGSSTNLLISRI